MCLWIHLVNHCQMWTNDQTIRCSGIQVEDMYVDCIFFNSTEYFVKIVPFFHNSPCLIRDHRYYTLIAVIYSWYCGLRGEGWGRRQGRGWMSKWFSQGEENVITVTFWWILQSWDKILEDINIIGHATSSQRTCGHQPFQLLILSIK